MASPVDFISGLRYASMPRSLEKLKAGAFTYHFFFSGATTSTMPCSRRLCPSITRVAMSASGTPVALLKNGTVRDERGFTSITYTLSCLSTMNWMLYRPTMPMPRPSRTV